MILAVFALSVTALVRSATPAPTSSTVQVIFTGICAFRDVETDAPFVLFPNLVVPPNAPNGTQIPVHQAYVRYNSADVLSNTHQQCFATTNVPRFDRACYLNNEQLELTEVKVGKATVDPTFDQLVVPTTEIIDKDSTSIQYNTWPVTGAPPLAARFNIPGGRLSAEDLEGCDWVFFPTKAGAPKRKLAQKVMLDVERASTRSVVLKSSNGKQITFKPDRDPVIEIGEIMKSQIKSLPAASGSYSAGDEDMHFYLHYSLLGYSCEVNGKPEQCPIPKVFGNCAHAISKATSATSPRAAAMSLPAGWYNNYLLYGSNCPPRR